jgi:ATP-dependent Lon protease|uniref:Lon protease n=1 Tax=Chloracidobacterium thermophilum TaxID=458033 RepID=A8DJR6_9BACT|nr:ATP-dependent protease La [Chloracidobacterium thermophilum]
MDEFHDSLPDNVASFPTVPVRDVVVFPHTAVRFKIGRKPSVMALKAALQRDRLIFLVTQHDPTLEEPTPDQVHRFGTVARITHHLQLADGNIKVQFEGLERARVIRFEESQGCWMALVERFPVDREQSPRITALVGKLTSLIDQYVRQSPDNPENLHADLRIEEPARFADSVASHLKISVEEKQKLLETVFLADRLMRLVDIFDIELEKLQVDRIIQGRVKKQMERSHREYYLSEKIKAIHKELGRKDERSEFEELKRRVEAANLPADAHEKAMSELRRLEQMPLMSAEAVVSRNYVEWLLSVPWHERSEENRDLQAAQQILDADHYGLEKVKERILEFLAVRQLVSRPPGSILCFVGPPGVGKTSLGKSIAKATGRKFVRLSLGGVRDDAEIRGHRRTYIGAFPGQIIQMMKKAGTVNPLILLDEVDKLTSDYRGDPAAALLEVLDPEQNNAFRDHYLDVEYDLSQVMFIATANVLHTIPPALRDRLEVIRLSGYTEREKLEIARRHLIPKQREKHGLLETQLTFAEDALVSIIQHYTREAGMRNMERDIAAICRKVARKVLLTPEQDRAAYQATITAADLPEYLGPPRYQPARLKERCEVGIATGLAWTEAGGEVLFVETALLPGRGQIILTGKLGDVMQESARAAMTYVRARADELGIAPDFYRRQDVHIHVPEGAIPKDGPSAGITIATALVSALTGIAVRQDVAMTGEITLRGKVLPIGGLKEKLLAALRLGIHTVLVPRDNEKDLAEIPEDVREALDIHFVEQMEQVLALALVEPPNSRLTGDKNLPDKALADDLPPIWDTDVTDQLSSVPLE